MRQEKSSGEGSGGVVNMVSDTRLKLAHAAQQGGKAERLLQEECAGRERHFRQALGVARHEQHLDAGLKLEDLAMEIRTAQPRHDDIADQKVDGARVFLGEIESILRRKGVED